MIKKRKEKKRKEKKRREEKRREALLFLLTSVKGLQDAAFTYEIW
ncbi:hypothetical protein [Desulfosporosinus burensis]